MRPHVFSEVAGPGGGLAACIAAMGLLSRMRLHVHGEVAGRREGLAARIAAMGLFSSVCTVRSLDAGKALPHVSQHARRLRWTWRRRCHMHKYRNGWSIFVAFEFF